MSGYRVEGFTNVNGSNDCPIRRFVRVQAFECCLCEVGKECRDLKPCCVGDSGIYGDMLLRTNLSSIFEGVDKSEIGL